MVSMSLGLSDQRGVHEVYNTIYDASVRHLASYGGPHTVCDCIIEATLLTPQCESSGMLPGFFSIRLGNGLISFLWLVQASETPNCSQTGVI